MEMIDRAVSGPDGDVWWRSERNSYEKETYMTAAAAGASSPPRDSKAVAVVSGQRSQAAVQTRTPPHVGPGMLWVGLVIELLERRFVAGPEGTFVHPVAWWAAVGTVAGGWSSDEGFQESER